MTGKTGIAPAIQKRSLGHPTSSRRRRRNHRFEDYCKLLSGLIMPPERPLRPAPSKPAIFTGVKRPGDIIQCFNSAQRPLLRVEPTDGLGGEGD